MHGLKWAHSTFAHRHAQYSLDIRTHPLVNQKKTPRTRDVVSPTHLPTRNCVVRFHGIG